MTTSAFFALILTIAAPAGLAVAAPAAPIATLNPGFDARDLGAAGEVAAGLAVICGGHSLHRVLEKGYSSNPSRRSSSMNRGSCWNG